MEAPDSPAAVPSSALQIFPPGVEDALLISLQQYTSGVFSQDDVGANLTAYEAPPSSQRRLLAAVSKLDSIKAGTASVDAMFSELRQNIYTQVRSGLEALPSSSQRRATAGASLATASSSTSGTAALSTGVQLLIEAASSEVELSPPILSSGSVASLRPTIPSALRSRSLSEGSTSSQSSTSSGPSPTGTSLPSTVSRTALTATPAAASPTADRLRWPLKDGLKGTAALHYRGPLSASEVIDNLQLDLSDNARRALTGSYIGYLKWFHFLGLVDQQTVVRRGPKRKAGSELRTEKWQCRLCHICLHVNSGHPSNLGTHLFGSDKRAGCLDDRRSDPIEDVPSPARDEAGKLLRLNAATHRRKAVRKPQPAHSKKPPFAKSSSTPVTLKDGLPFELSQVASAVAQASSSAPATGSTSSQFHLASSRLANAVRYATGLPDFRIQPFFYLATDSSLNFVSATSPAENLTGWNNVLLSFLKLTDIIDPEDRILVENLLRPQPGDATELRILFDIGDSTGAAPSSAQVPREALTLPFGWYTTSAFPGPHREIRVLVRHLWGWNDPYWLRLHFCPAPGLDRSLPSMILVWTFLKIGNGPLNQADINPPTKVSLTALEPGPVLISHDQDPRVLRLSEAALLDRGAADTGRSMHQCADCPALSLPPPAFLSRRGRSQSPAHWKDPHTRPAHYGPPTSPANQPSFQAAPPFGPTLHERSNEHGPRPDSPPSVPTSLNLPNDIFYLFFSPPAASREEPRTGLCTAFHARPLHAAAAPPIPSQDS
ncbi:hypothetical protein V8E36_006359 [Tilletia maclaganii]